MNEVVKILMNRDELTEEEANEIVSEIKDMIIENSYDYEFVQDVMMDEYGLEMDYIFDILDFK